MIRFKMTFDKDAEEAWINDWCQRGWALVSFRAGVCTFVPCQPGEYIYQIDLMPGEGLRARDPEGYRSFMEDTGVEVVQRWARWVYLRRRAEEGPFEVYTDPQSKMEQYRRIRRMFLWFLAVEALCSASVWGTVLTGGAELFHRVLAGIYAVIFMCALRVIWRCTRKLRELEGQI